MATLTKQVVTTAGLADSLASAAGGGDQFTNTGNEWLEVLNGGGASIDVTIATPATANGEPIADRVVAVAAGARKKIGPFNPSIFNDSSGYVQVTYSAVTSVTVGVFKLG
jgi:hypothetical protein